MTTQTTIDKDIWNRLAVEVESEVKDELQKKRNKAIEKFKGTEIQPWFEKIGGRTMRFYPPQQVRSAINGDRY